MEMEGIVTLNNWQELAGTSNLCTFEKVTPLGKRAEAIQQH